MILEELATVRDCLESGPIPNCPVKTYLGDEDCFEEDQCTTCGMVDCPMYGVFHPKVDITRKKAFLKKVETSLDRAYGEIVYRL